MKYILIIIAAICILCSCGTGLQISKAEFKPIDKNFSGTFVNKPYRSKSRDLLMPPEMFAQTVLQLCHIYHLKADSVLIKFNTKGQLQVTFVDSNGNDSSKLFDGVISKNGYYEVYLSKIREDIPPLFSIIYGYHDMDRIRIGLTKSNDLIIDNMWEYYRTIFIFGDGGSGRSQNYFKATSTTN
jgi:hypothetical protein